MDRVANHAATLGENVGRLFEDAVVRNIAPVIEELGYTVGAEKMTDNDNNKYQIDLVVRDGDSKPVILIESKYIRYTKHNRDKGSWLCTAHHNLKKRYPTIRKLTAILAGNWSKPSLDMLKSFGVDATRIEFKHFVNVLLKYNIEFDWDEKDKETPKSSLEKFKQLSVKQKEDIGDMLISTVVEKLKNDIRHILNVTVPLERRISNVEVVLRTDLNESIVYEFKTVSAAIKQLLQLTSDRPVSDNDVEKLNTRT